MNRGTWHQFGDRSQKIALKQLQNGVGVGAIISSRDLRRHKAIEYAAMYHDCGAQVLIDLQFYVPNFMNKPMESYELGDFRNSVSTLNQIGDSSLAELHAKLLTIHQEIQADAVLAPAVVYESGRADIVALNQRLFTVANSVGNDLGIPTYATVVLGKSATATNGTIDAVVSSATSLQADGWYYAFEFPDARLPTSREQVYRCCRAGIFLALTGYPTLHAYAGPLGIISLGFGSTGVGIGHPQNTWGFTRARWEPSADGGGGDAPPRFFSQSLWGTIIYPDEIAQLSNALASQVIRHSPYSSDVAFPPVLPWDRWESNKHLLHVIGSTIGDLAASSANARQNAQDARNRLQQAVALHSQIADHGVALKDETNAYQENWANAISDLLNEHDAEFDFLELL